MPSTFFFFCLSQQTGIDFWKREIVDSFISTRRPLVEDEWRRIGIVTWQATYFIAVITPPTPPPPPPSPSLHITTPTVAAAAASSSTAASSAAAAPADPLIAATGIE